MKFMSIEETVFKLKDKYLKQSCDKKYGSERCNPKYIIIQSDLTIQRKDGKPINRDDFIIKYKKDYVASLKAAEYKGKMELLNEIFEDNPEYTSIEME